MIQNSLRTRVNSLWMCLNIKLRTLFTAFGVRLNGIELRSFTAVSKVSNPYFNPHLREECSLFMDCRITENIPSTPPPPLKKKGGEGDRESSLT